MRRRIAKKGEDSSECEEGLVVNLEVRWGLLIQIWRFEIQERHLVFGDFETLGNILGFGLS